MKRRKHHKSRHVVVSARSMRASWARAHFKKFQFPYADYVECMSMLRCACSASLYSGTFLTPKMWCAQSSSIVNKRGDQCNNTRNIHEKNNNSTQYKSARKGEKELISCRSFLIMLLQFLNFIFLSSLSTSPFCAFFRCLFAAFFRFTLPLALAHLSVADSTCVVRRGCWWCEMCLLLLKMNQRREKRRVAEKKNTETKNRTRNKIYKTFWDSLELNNLRRDL